MDNPDEASGPMDPELANVLEVTGYLEDGEPAAGLVTANANDSSRRLRYSAAFDASKLGARAIFEAKGVPCIYFASVVSGDPRTVREIHRMAWNHGLAPVLWVATPLKVVLYDCYAPPVQSDEDMASRELCTFQYTSEGLAELKQLAGRLEMETGAFWDTPEGRRVSKAGRVDAQLIRDVEGAQDRLASIGELDARVAQALVMRTIFLAYLVHRGVLSADFMQRRFGCNDLRSVFQYVNTANDVFSWLKTTFQGDLFDGAGSSLRLRKDHVAILSDFVTGTDQRTGQTSLFPYDFSVVPIELVSSIYERFSHAGNSSDARQNSTHYTPLDVVDLLLNEAMSQCAGDEKVLDIACGSGVFLVEALRRLVFARTMRGEALTRAMIRRVLHEQIFGVDIDASAIAVAAFSLSLAALELDPDPRPPHALRFRRLVGRSLLATDAFNLPAVKALALSNGADIVVGNPPWTRTPSKVGLRFCQDEDLPLMRKAVDQAFLWRALSLTAPGGIVGLVLTARTFFSMSGQARAVREALVDRIAPRLLVDLSELRKKGLFPNATAPAVVFVGRRSNDQRADTFAFIHVVDPGDYKRRGALEISGDDVRHLPVEAMVGPNNTMKIAAWGTARDASLISRLSRGPTLGDLVEEMGWSSGQGFQTVNGKETPLHLRGMPVVVPKNFHAFGVPDDSMSQEVPERMHRPRDAKIYHGPVLIVTRGIGGRGFRSALSWSSVLYPEVFTGIAGSDRDKEFLQLINGILNSSLARYFFFLTSAGWGLERDEVKPVELLQLPLPRSLLQDPHALEVLAAEALLRESVERGELSGSREEEGRARLDAAVYRLYGVNGAETALVEDVLAFGLDRFKRGKKSVACRKVDGSTVEAYVDAATEVFNALFNALGERRMAGEIVVASGPLVAVALRIRSASEVASTRAQKVAKAEGRLETLIESLRQNLQTNVGRRVSGYQSLRVYTQEAVYVIKPNVRRYWTRAAALNDADVILAESVLAEEERGVGR